MSTAWVHFAVVTFDSVDSAIDFINRHHCKPSAIYVFAGNTANVVAVFNLI